MVTTLADIEASVSREVATLMSDFPDDLDQSAPTFGMTALSDPLTCEDPLFKDDELQSALDRFQESRRVPPFGLRDALIAYLRRRSIEFMIAEEYDFATVMDGLIGSLEQAYVNEREAIENEILDQQIRERMNALEQQRRDMIEFMTRKLREHQEKEEVRIQKVSECQEKERGMFALHCESRGFLARFSKPSLDLINLRKLQKNCALARDFEGAKRAKLNADRRQVIETEVAKKKAMETVEVLYRQLLERQERDMVYAKQNSRRRLAEIEKEMGRQNDHYRLLVKQLRARMLNAGERKSAVLPRLKPIGVPVVQRKLAEYRRSLDRPVLAVRLDMKSILGKVRLSK
jgi:hypothetical protein